MNIYGYVRVSSKEQNEDRQAYRNAAGASAGSENYGTGILAVSD